MDYAYRDLEPEEAYVLRSFKSSLEIQKLGVFEKKMNCRAYHISGPD